MPNDRNTTPAPDRDRQHGDGSDPVHELWDLLAINLRAQLDRLADGSEGDFLRLEVLGSESEGTYPYVEFSATAAPGVLYATIPGNVLVHPLYKLDRNQCAALRRMGWFGNDPSGEVDWLQEFLEVDSMEVAQEAVLILRDYFGIAHPQLLTFQASGLDDDHTRGLGLCASTAVPIAKPAVATGWSANAPTLTSEEAFVPEDHADLVVLVAEALEQILGDEPDTDVDGDFVLMHMDQSVWVRVHEHQPGVEILARVAHGVQSRRAAAVEVTLRNRDADWITWSLRGRDIWQRILIPGMPFVPAHLEGLLPLFLHAMAATRDDLALRTGAEVG